MRVRVVESFDIYKKGGIFDWPAPVVKLLKARGLVEEYQEEAPPKPAQKPEPKKEIRVEVADEPAAPVERASYTTKSKRRQK